MDFLVQQPKHITACAHGNKITLHSVFSQLRHKFMQSLRARFEWDCCDVDGCVVETESSTSLSSSSEISTRLFVVVTVLEYCFFSCLQYNPKIQ